MAKAQKVTKEGEKVVTVSEFDIRPFHLENEKRNKIDRLKTYVNNQLSQGYTTSNGIKMDSTEQSVQRLENGYKIAKNAGQKAMDVVDYHNTIHKDIALTTVDSMITELSNHVSSWYWHKQNKRQAIQTATIKTELEAIDITSGNPNEAN